MATPKAARTSINIDPADLARFKAFKVERYGEKGGHVPHEEAFHDLIKDWFQARGSKPPRGRRTK